MRDRLPEHNLFAGYPQLEGARKAITTLELHGVEGDDISLLTRDGESEEPSREQTRSRDSGVTRQVGSRVGIGAALGGAAGLLGTLAAFAVPGVGAVVGAGLWASLVGGALAGGAVGGFIGGESALRNTEAWELTFETIRHGGAVVGVHSQDEEVVERAVAALEDTNPERLERFGAEGERVDADGN